MTDSDRKEVTAAIASHDASKALGYIDAVQDASRSIVELVQRGRKCGQEGIYFAALDDVAKELDRLLLTKRRA